jgi:prolyl-tRNA synthetase
MRVSQLFTKTQKTTPADETAKNAQLLIRAGFIHKEMAGVYAYLPLGLKVIENIKKVIREEMNAVGGQEMVMTNLQPKALWEKTSRWDESVVDIWFKTKLQDETEVGLAWSHEEPILNMMQPYVTSYRDLPTSVYQFQTKLRNELRAKSGVMRGREFIMKDMYSLHTTAEDLDAYYDRVKQAYMKIFKRFGLGDDTYVTFASGGAFTKFSHEFQTLCEAGEDTLYLHREKRIAVNEEVLDEAVRELGIQKDDLEKVKSAEVGNIFNFGSEKSEQMGISYADRTGARQPIFLASYGIGVSRLMGVIAEKFADEKGLIWPATVAPFRYHLVALGGEDTAVAAQKLYKSLGEDNVLYDDRTDASAGEKFADAELIGCPIRLVVSEKTLARDSVEVTSRRAKFATKDITLSDHEKLAQLTA